MRGDRSSLRAAALASAVTIPLVIVLAVLLRPDPVAPRPPTPSAVELPPIDVSTPPVTAAADQLCPGLIGGLPIELSGLRARPVRSASAYTAAWGEPPVILVCGVARPAAFVVGTPDLVQINGVQWLAEPGGTSTVFTTVDRGVYVAVTVPTELAGGPISVLSPIVTDRLPAQEPQPAPTG